MNLSDLATFVQVADRGTLSGAAKALGVPKSTVSRRVSRLEDALGVPLLVRSARAVALTDDGRRLHARSAPALRELDDVEREVTERLGAPAGRLRLTAPPDITHGSFLNAILAEYRERWPSVVIEVSLTNRVVDLVEEGFDVALRPNADMLRDAGTIMGRRLATAAPGIWASSAYIARAGRPEKPEDLVNHDCVLHPALRGGGLPLKRVGEDAVKDYPVREAMSVNDFSVVADLVGRGVGIGVIPSPGHQESLQELVQVLPEWTLPPTSLWLIWPASRHLSPRVRAFVDLAVERGVLPT